MKDIIQENLNIIKCVVCNHSEFSRKIENILRKPLKSQVYFAGDIYDRFRQIGVPSAIL